MPRATSNDSQDDTPEPRRRSQDQAYEPPDPSARISFVPRIVASVCGLEGTGKTEFGAGMPDAGGIDYFSIDPNTAEVLEKHQDRKRIRFHQFSLPPPALTYDEEPKDTKRFARSQETAFLKALSPILRREYRKAAPSLVIDTATEFFALSLLADHGKTTQIWPTEARGVTNTRWKQLLRALKDCGCNVVLLSRLRDEYANVTVRKAGGKVEESREKTGDYEREGFNQMGFYINVEAHLLFDPKEKRDQRFGLKVRRCTQRPALIGLDWWGDQELEGDTVRSASFAFLARQVFKRTALKDWQ